MDNSRRSTWRPSLGIISPSLDRILSFNDRPAFSLNPGNLADLHARLRKVHTFETQQYLIRPVGARRPAGLSSAANQWTYSR
jgi:hypothetical protein